MADMELYKTALPVVVVPPGTVAGPEILFKSPLPVVVLNQESGGGGDGSLPERLAPEAVDLLDEDLDAPVLAVYNGWYFSSEFVNNPFGDNIPSFLELIVGPGGAFKIQRVTRADTGWTNQRAVNGNEPTGWTRLDNVIE